MKTNKRGIEKREVTGAGGKIREGEEERKGGEEDISFIFFLCLFKPYHG